MEQSLRDFSNSYSSRGIQGGDKWRIHYHNESNDQKDVERFTEKENSNEASEGKSTEAQKYSWGEKYENKDQPRPYGAEMHRYDHKYSHHHEENETDHHMNGDREFLGDHSLEKENYKSTTSTKHNEYDHYDQEYSDDDKYDEANIANISDTEKEIENNEESERDSFINYGYDTTKFLYEETVTEG